MLWFVFCGVSMGCFHVTSSPPYWWTKAKDLSLAPFVRPQAIAHCTIVICVSRDCLQTTFDILKFSRKQKVSSRGSGE